MFNLKGFAFSIFFQFFFWSFLLFFFQIISLKTSWIFFFLFELKRGFNYFFFWLNFIFKIKIIFYSLLLRFNWNAFFRFRFWGLYVSYIHNTLLLWSCCILFSHIQLCYFLFLDLFLSLSLLNNWFTLFFLFFWLLRLCLWLLLFRLRFILMFFIFLFFLGLIFIPKITYKFSQMLKKMLIFICFILRKLMRIILVILWNHLFIK